MKHHVFFFLSTISFVSFSSEHTHSISLPNAYYAMETFRIAIGRSLLSPEELNNRCSMLKNVNKQDEKECFQMMIQRMEEDGSLKNLEEWSKLHNGPQKKINRIR